MVREQGHHVQIEFDLFREVKGMRAIKDLATALVAGVMIIGFLLMSLWAYNRDFHHVEAAEEETITCVDLVALMLNMETGEDNDMGYAVYESVPVEFEDQVTINSFANNYGVPISFVWAIAAKETQFDADAVGDNGDSIGMFQINTKWQSERMEDLGVEKADLVNPVDCALVAIDYMAELYAIKGSWAFVAMAYNEGPESAKEKWRKETYRTDYSLEVLAYMDEFTR